MKCSLIIPKKIEKKLLNHLFQNELEQGAFLFAQEIKTKKEIILNVLDEYLIPKTGWKHQMDIYLEMNESERVKIMKKALSENYAIIDCHSHPNSRDSTWFSASDIKGISEFATYVKWKLNGKAFGAMVWGECSVDAVIWYDDFNEARKVNKIIIVEGNEEKSLKPLDTWWSKYRRKKWNLKGIQDKN